MVHPKKQLGGFVALNTGHISDCYSAVALRHTRHALSGGFCGENRGILERCAAQGRVHGRGEKGGFCGRQKGRSNRTIWLRSRQEAEARWTDWEYSLTGEDVSADGLEGWDFEKVWHLHDDSAPVRLRLYDRPPAPTESGPVVEIGDRKALLEFAQQINEGTADPAACYRLTADIDLGGRAWTPVGLDGNTPFTGCFDGCGHQIHNFVVSAGKVPFAGFFGYIGKRGTVRNLGVDCVLLGKGASAGALCAYNAGEIVNCTASFHGEPSRYTGGLVAQNSGTVRHCAALGRIGKMLPLPWWAVALVLVALCIPAPVYFSLTALAAGQEVFAPVILDPNAKPIEPEQDLVPEPEETGDAEDTSASFIMNAEMYVSTENYAGTIGLRCPTWSTRGFVATFRVSQEDLRRVGYETEEAYLPLYQSGLIAPGYGVEVITLGSLPDGTNLPAGEYELSVLLEFYDMQTNEKSAVDTVVPLDVTVQ